MAHCDHCGEELQDMNSVSEEPFHIESLPTNFVNGKSVGDSAVLCEKCFWFVQHAETAIGV